MTNSTRYLVYWQSGLTIGENLAARRSGIKLIASWRTEWEGKFRRIIPLVCRYCVRKWQLHSRLLSSTLYAISRAPPNFPFVLSVSPGGAPLANSRRGSRICARTSTLNNNQTIHTWMLPLLTLGRPPNIGLLSSILGLNVWLVYGFSPLNDSFQAYLDMTREVGIHANNGHALHRRILYDCLQLAVIQAYTVGRSKRCILFLVLSGGRKS